MEKLSQNDMDVIIDAYWPRTRSRTNLYKMLQEAADVSLYRLLQKESKQEPVANYQLSAPVPPPPPQHCPRCGKDWSEHDFGVPSPYCP